MGLPANLAIDVEQLPLASELEGIGQAVEELIRESLRQRPDVAAARATALAAEAEVRRVRSQGLPTLSLGATGGRTYFQVGDREDPRNADRHDDVLSTSLLLRVPLFTGFTQTYNVQRAQEQADAARERVRSLEQLIIFQVFSGYYAVQTATEKVRTSDELLASAGQSVAVALGRYREGVGTILDLVSAQTALSDARAQRIQSILDWYIALGQLAHDTGLLGLKGDTPLAPSSGERRGTR
jgi:outer membrane protein TolC